MDPVHMDSPYENPLSLTAWAHVNERARTRRRRRYQRPRSKPKRRGGGGAAWGTGPTWKRRWVGLVEVIVGGRGGGEESQVTVRG
ncbi:hypothetical protein [Oryza sativa Japonica Group]|uniref:Uncharacterized protein n=2 Tax=Oryza sativa subsp. japonica TaxID=39947 RepID=Q5JMJ3_ORYSJ|nr:hypothetical protein [Oryza sativa Japonica Group]BAD87606.1 hypothetical protein [Oryza sativa Japonica Group]